ERLRLHVLGVHAGRDRRELDLPGDAVAGGGGGVGVPDDVAGDVAAGVAGRGELPEDDGRRGGGEGEPGDGEGGAVVADVLRERVRAGDGLFGGEVLLDGH